MEMWSLSLTKSAIAIAIRPDSGVRTRKRLHLRQDTRSRKMASGGNIAGSYVNSQTSDKLAFWKPLFCESNILVFSSTTPRPKLLLRVNYKKRQPPVTLELKVENLDCGASNHP